MGHLSIHLLKNILAAPKCWQLCVNLLYSPHESLHVDVDFQPYWVNTNTVTSGPVHFGLKETDKLASPLLRHYVSYQQGATVSVVPHTC